MNCSHDRGRNEKRKLFRRGRRISLAIVTAVSCVAVGLLVGGLLSETATFFTEKDVAQRPAQSYDSNGGVSNDDASLLLGPVPTLEVNADGLTYGSALFANSAEDEPDLISVLADDEITEGYVYKTDLEEEAPASPAEARSAPSRTVDVYEADGHTVIGSFTIGGAPHS